MKSADAIGSAAPAIPLNLDAQPLWSVDDVCRFLGFSKRWLHERTRLGEIPCYRFGSALRFHPVEVTCWAARFHHAPAADNGGGNRR